MPRKPTTKTILFADGSKSVFNKNGNGEGTLYFQESKNAWRASYVLEGETIRRYVTEMKRAVNSLVVMVDDLFELVQLDQGVIEAEIARARFEDVARSAIAACESHAAQKGLVIETDLHGAESSLCSPRLTRVLQNLLQNAIRHTPADGTVRIEARQTAGALEVVVTDTGEGIDEASLGRVFEPFFRVDDARSQGGSGLGLAIAKRIVEAMGGDITVASKPQSGSRFAILLPDRA